MSKKNSSLKKQPKVQEENADFYEVEQILDKRLTSIGMVYLIKWKGFPDPKDYTWEPIQHLTEVEDLLMEFNIKDKQRTEEEREDRESVDNNEENSEDEETSEKAPSKKRGRKRGGKQREKKSQVTVVKSDESDEEDIKPRKQEPKRTKETRRTKTTLPPISPPQVDKFWEREGLELGRICKHFNEEGDLIFLINLNKEDFVHGSVQLSSEQLRSINEERLIDYMENWLRRHLSTIKEKEGKDYLSFEAFWDKVA